jgi:endonuclease V-like protein UPF0215 family
VSGFGSHLLAFDDAPFERSHRGDVPVVGVAFSDLRVEGVLSDAVRRDGANSTDVLERMVLESQFAAHTTAVLLQGIALAGFNVVDIHALHERLGMAVLVVARREPDYRAIESALRMHVRGGLRKWALIQRAGLMEPCADLYAQRAGLTMPQAEALVRRLAVHGKVPEPLRLAHLIAGGLATGRSRGRA